MPVRDDITITFKRTEALALARVAQTGIAVTEVLGLIQSTVAAKNGLSALNGALAERRK